MLMFFLFSISSLGKVIEVVNINCVDVIFVLNFKKRDIYKWKKKILNVTFNSDISNFISIP